MAAGPVDWQPGFGNTFAQFSSGETFHVPVESRVRPSEFVLADWLKFLHP
jgi:hypothetical protein